MPQKRSFCAVLAFAFVSAILTIALFDWLAVDILHRELFGRASRRHALRWPSCFGPDALVLTARWALLEFDNTLRDNLIRCGWIAGALCLMLMASRRARRPRSARVFVAGFVASTIVIAAIAIIGVASARSEVLWPYLHSDGAGPWIVDSWYDARLQYRRNIAVFTGGLTALALSTLSAGAVTFGLNCLRPRARLSPKLAWMLIAAFAPVLLGAGNYALVHQEFYINSHYVGPDDFETWTAALCRGRLLTVAAAAAVTLAATLTARRGEFARLRPRARALVAACVALASVSTCLTTPHRDAVDHLYPAPDPGYGHIAFNYVPDPWTIHPPRTARCPTDIPDYEIEPLALVARIRRDGATDRHHIELMELDHAEAAEVDDSPAFAAWLHDRMITRRPVDDRRYIVRTGERVLLRTPEQQLEVMILADAEFPLDELSAAVARVSELVDGAYFGVGAVAEVVYPTELGDAVVRTHCEVGWLDAAQWRARASGRTTWGELAASPDLPDRSWTCSGSESDYCTPDDR